MMNEDEHHKQVYAQFGLALFLAQVLEHGIVNGLLYAELIPNNLIPKIKKGTHDQSLWEKEVDAFYKKQFDYTLGKMIKVQKTVLIVPEGLDELLEASLERRNRLAHHYFRERADAWLTEAGRDGMIKELEASGEMFREADALLESTLKPLRENFGVSDEMLEDFYQRYF